MAICVKYGENKWYLYEMGGSRQVVSLSMTTTIDERKEHVRWATAITIGTFLEPGAYELALLEEYVQGQRSLDEIILLLEQRTLQMVA